MRKSAPYGNDFLNDLRGGMQDSEDEFVKLEELGFGRGQEYSAQSSQKPQRPHNLLDGLQVQDPSRKALGKKNA